MELNSATAHLREQIVKLIREYEHKSGLVVDRIEIETIATAKFSITESHYARRVIVHIKPLPGDVLQMWTPLRPDSIDEPTHERLLNWSEWVIVRRNYGHCGSIEYRYLPERISDPDARRDEQIRIAIDPEDAQLLESTIAGSLFPRNHRIILKSYYVHRMRKQECCRKMGIRFADFPRRIGEAATILTNRLTNKF